jgi:hypothetical protein
VLMARSLQRKVVGHRLRGAPVVGLEVDDLVQHARKCFLEDRPLFDPNSQTLARYLFRRMDDEVKRVLDRRENDATGYYSTDDDTAEPYLNVIRFAEFRFVSSNVEADNYIKRFVEWLGRTDSDLAPLAKVAIYYGHTDCAGQAAALDLPVALVYRLRERLKIAIAHFNSLARTETEK